MDRFVALYRGINVGGKNMVKMESLRAMHEGLGHRDVASYVQSGNIVFAARGMAELIAKKLVAQFAKEFGFAAQVVVVPTEQWGDIVRENPYAKAAADLPKTVHAAISGGKPSTTGLKALLEKTRGTEAFVVKGGTIYLHAPDGIGNSKFAAAMERAGGVPITARNWRTVEAIWKMLVVEDSVRPASGKRRSG